MSPQSEPSTQEVLAGLVERVMYHNAENGFCVLRARARGHRDVVTVAMPQPFPPASGSRPQANPRPAVQGAVPAQSLGLTLEAQGFVHDQWDAFPSKLEKDPGSSTALKREPASDIDTAEVV